MVMSIPAQSSCGVDGVQLSAGISVVCLTLHLSGLA